MNHHHQHQHPERLSGFFAVAIIANLGLTLFQAVYAYLAHSTSLLADAGHNLSDVLGLLLAWISLLLLKKRPTHTLTYGYKKLTLLTSATNAAILFIACGVIVRETAEKFIHPTDVGATAVIIVALVGVGVNVISALLFMKDSKEDINVKAAFLHLAYDALISMGVVVTGVVMYLTHWYWVDPLVGTVITLIIIWGTWGLLKESVRLVLDGVPKSIALEKVNDFLRSIEGVSDLHDLHIWALSSKQNALTVHLVMPKKQLTDSERQAITNTLKERFTIEHVTIQIEQDAEACPQGHCH